MRVTDQKMVRLEAEELGLQSGFGSLRVLLVGLVAVTDSERQENLKKFKRLMGSNDSK